MHTEHACTLDVLSVRNQNGARWKFFFAQLETEIHAARIKRDGELLSIAVDSHPGVLVLKQGM